jgi:hypothetical protein
VRFDIHPHCHNLCTIHVGREVISILPVELERKQGKRIRGECASNVITGDDSICVGSNVQ